jgi:hypothetical protein
LKAATTKGGIAKLIRQLIRRRPGPIVVEATGGYEELAMALFDASVCD